MVVAAVLGPLLLGWGSSSMIELTGDTFEDAISADTLFVKFYAPWCRHSKKLAPVSRRARQTAPTPPPLPSSRSSRISPRPRPVGTQVWEELASAVNPAAS